MGRTLASDIPEAYFLRLLSEFFGACKISIQR